MDESIGGERPARPQERSLLVEHGYCTFDRILSPPMLDRLRETCVRLAETLPEAQRFRFRFQAGMLPRHTGTAAPYPRTLYRPPSAGSTGLHEIDLTQTNGK